MQQYIRKKPRPTECVPTSAKPQIPGQVHANVMEMLVAEEVEKQLQHHPQRLVKFINRIEVATFALNHLPALYASSEEGRRKQEDRGRQELSGEINTAVRQAFMAVQRDPLRFSTPILQEDSQEAQVALESLRKLLPYQQRDVSWQNLAVLVQQTLHQKEQKLQKVQKAQKAMAARGDMGRERNQQSWGDERYVR